MPFLSTLEAAKGRMGAKSVMNTSKPGTSDDECGVVCLKYVVLVRYMCVTCSSSQSQHETEERTNHTEEFEDSTK